jgi:hypothetical protein
MRFLLNNKSLCGLLVFYLALPALELRAQIPDADIWAVGEEHAEGQLTIFNNEPNGGTIGLPLELGDFDGDGKTDFVSTAMFADTGPLDARLSGGEVYIYPGENRLEGVLDRAGRPGSAPGLTLIAARSGDFLGTELFTADINGDGIDDLLIGAQNHDRVAADGQLLRDNCGGLFVVIGRDGLLDENNTLDLLQPNEDVILLLGAEEGERAGVWVESGDLDGDGIDDILLGADQFPVAPRGEDPRIRSGKVYVIYGRPNFPEIMDLADETDAVSVILGRDTGDHFGATIHARDLDGDGRDELIVAAALARLSASLAGGSPIAAVGTGGGDGPGNGRPDCGEVYVFYSSVENDGRLPSLIDLGEPLEPGLNQRLTTIYGRKGDDMLGEELSSGDLNGDGRMDLIFGALMASGPRLERRAGMGAIIYGWDGLRGATIDLAPEPAANPPPGLRTAFLFGSYRGDILADTLTAADLDRDGFDDLCVGIPRYDYGEGLAQRSNVGAALVIYGDPIGLPESWEPLREELPCNLRIKAVVGAEPEDLLAYSLVAGDADGDGHPDLFVNAMRGDGGADAVPDAGEVIAVSGRLLSERRYRVDSIEPFSGELGVPIPVTISGGDFETGPDTRVLLGESELEDVRIICTNRIEAVLPPSELRGPRDLTVTGPAGSVTFSSAFYYLDGKNFLRGDADLSGTLGLTDGIYTLTMLFLGNRELCPDASDFDDNGLIHVTDAISLFLFLFQGGPPPMPPYPLAGEDPSPDDLDCGS